MEESVNDPPFTDAEIRASLARLVKSRVLSRSQRLCRFLEFTVNSLLDGTADQLKETSIGMRVYDRKASYAKGDDSIVRTEARRLRGKLQEYYDTEGQDDPVVLQFPTGSYVPAFTRRELSPLASITPQKGLKGDAGTAQERHGLLIAVLPLTDVSGAEFSGRCARMLTEEFIHGWMHVEGVTVVGTEALPPILDPAEAVASAQRHGVHFLITGSVSEENGCLRVTLRLLRPDRLLVWSQRFDAKADAQGLHRLTDELASAMISRLRPETSEVRRELRPLPAEYVSTLSTLLEAEAMLEDGPGENLQIAANKLEEVVRLTPTNVRPICDLANCYCISALHGVSGSGSLIDRALEVAERAVGLEQPTGLSLTTQAHARMLAWSWHEAEAGFQQALVSGEHVFTFRQYALYLMAWERFDEAEFFIDKAQRIDPFSGRQKLLRTLFFYYARRAEDLQEHSARETAFGLFPAGSKIMLAFNHAQHQRLDEAKRIVSNCRKEAAGQPSLMTLIAEVLALCGDATQARQIASVFKLFSPASPISHYRRALLSLALGDVDSAWTNLDHARAQREPELIWLKVEPRLDPLRIDGRFASILGGVTADKAGGIRERL